MPMALIPGGVAKATIVSSHMADFADSMDQISRIATINLKIPKINP
jgi:hypothetical protein